MCLLFKAALQAEGKKKICLVARSSLWSLCRVSWDIGFPVEQLRDFPPVVVALGGHHAWATGPLGLYMLSLVWLIRMCLVMRLLLLTDPWMLVSLLCRE